MGEGHAAFLDARGQLCPMPIIRASQEIRKIPVGSLLVVLSDDAGIRQDLPAWCRSHGHQMVSLEGTDQGIRAAVRRLT